MIPVSLPEPPPDPIIQRKIRYFRIFGIGSVLALWIVAMASWMGFLPPRLGGPALIAEILLGPLVIGKIRSLRNQSAGGGVYNTRKT
jgi:hypothetical protein